jgi:hypothetical protein
VGVKKWRLSLFDTLHFAVFPTSPALFFYYHLYTYNPLKPNFQVFGMQFSTADRGVRENQQCLLGYRWFSTQVAGLLWSRMYGGVRGLRG